MSNHYRCWVKIEKSLTWRHFVWNLTFFSCIINAFPYNSHGGTLKWLVYIGKSPSKKDDLGTPWYPYFRKPPYADLWACLKRIESILNSPSQWLNGNHDHKPLGTQTPLFFANLGHRFFITHPSGCHGPACLQEGWQVLHWGPKKTSLDRSGLGIDVPFWGFVSHHQNKYLLEIITPIVGWCETLGHLPTPVDVLPFPY